MVSAAATWTIWPHKRLFVHNRYALKLFLYGDSVADAVTTFMPQIITVAVVFSLQLHWAQIKCNLFLQSGHRFVNGAIIQSRSKKRLTCHCPPVRSRLGQLFSKSFLVHEFMIGLCLLVPKICHSDNFGSVRTDLLLREASARKIGLPFIF